MDSPDLPALDVDEREARAMGLISFNMIAMGGYVEDLPAAVELYIQARDAQKMGAPAHLMFAWQRFAAQQGIITVYNYALSAKAAAGLLRSAKTLHGLVDHKRIELSRVRLNETFPKLTQLRQTVMHQGELMDTEQNFDINKNRLNEGFGYNGVVSACMVDNVYTASHAGTQVDFELSFTKADLLRAICQEFFSAFPTRQR